MADISQAMFGCVVIVASGPQPRTEKRATHSVGQRAKLGFPALDLMRAKARHTAATLLGRYGCRGLTLCYTSASALP